LPVVALLVRNSNTTCYLKPTFESTTFLQMYTTATLTHAAEMTLLADNDCCTTTFTYCTWRPRLTWRKSRLN